MNQNVEWGDLITCYKYAKNEDQKVMYLNLIRELSNENEKFAKYVTKQGMSI